MCHILITVASLRANFLESRRRPKAIREYSASSAHNVNRLHHQAGYGTILNPLQQCTMNNNGQKSVQECLVPLLSWLIIIMNVPVRYLMSTLHDIDVRQPSFVFLRLLCHVSKYLTGQVSKHIIEGEFRSLSCSIKAFYKDVYLG